jgi:UDP-N-acetylmuramate--alanine ligase
VFQPHLYSRTERFSREFGEALATADVVVVTDVFGAREEPVPGVTGELVADAVRDAGATVHYVPHRLDLASFLAPQLVNGDLVLSLGAGDITLLHTELAPLLGARP